MQRFGVMMLCVFILPDPADPRVKTCSRDGCGNRIVSDYPPERCYAECKSPSVAPPLVKRALNFVRAAFGQAPLAIEAIIEGDSSIAFRSREEIERIAAICKACPLFDGQVCTHRNCGCTISADRNEFWSKLAWRSQRCPDDPPRWT